MYTQIHILQPDQVSSHQIHIKNAIIEALEFRCQCKIPRSNLLEGKFSCRSSNSHATYRNILIGTYNTNATELLNFLQDWVDIGPTVEVDWYYVDIDSSCPVRISSLREPECKNENQCNDPKYVRCAEHLNNRDIDRCFESCIAQNG